jgi:tetratricopeptide (TPR) repeat protein
MRIGAGASLVVVSSVIVAGALTAASEQAPPQPVSDRDHREALKFFRAGQEQYARERFEPAAEQFRLAAGRDPLLDLAHYSLGQAYMQLGRFTEAADAYKACIEAERTLHALAESNQFAAERRRDDDIRELKEIIDRLASDPKTAKSPRILQLQGRVEDLQRQRTVVGSPFHPPAEVLLALGSAYFRGGLFEQAEFEWQAAVAANPKLGEAHNNLAALYMRAGRLDEAAASLSRAEQAGFRVNPQFKQDLELRRRTPR